MTFDFDVARRKMVDNQIRTTDVTSHEVIRAFASVPREAFVPNNRKPLAYIDEDLLIKPAEAGAPARYLMEPSPHAKLVQLARVGSDDVVLDVGCGLGYSAAILSQLASAVVALECDEELAEAASARLSELGYDNVAVVTGPLEQGYPPEAPYDVIFVGGAVEVLPDTLIEQLREGGRLVVVEGSGNASKAMIYSKDDGIVSRRRAFNTAVKPLPGFGRKPEFTF